MTNTSCTIRTRKFMTNPLLQRRQFVRARRDRGRDDDGDGEVGALAMGDDGRARSRVPDDGAMRWMTMTGEYMTDEMFFAR
jgi:hypothetical protein